MTVIHRIEYIFRAADGKLRTATLTGEDLPFNTEFMAEMLSNTILTCRMEHVRIVTVPGESEAGR